MNHYLVALAVGGVMEKPNYTYSDYQIIEADNSTDAYNKYNKINKCSYYYGHVVAKVMDIDKVKPLLKEMPSDNTLLLDLSFEGAIVKED